MPAAQWRKDAMFLVLGNDGKMGRRNKHKGETADVCPNFSPPGFCVEMTGVHHRIGGNGRDRSYLGPRQEAQEALFCSVTPCRSVLRQEAWRFSFPGKATAKLRLKAERDLGGICCWRRCVCSRLGSSQYRGWGREEESLLEKLRVRSPLRSFLYPTTCLTQPKGCVLGAGGAHSCPGLTWNG